uniref:Uncharacterized protein n=1 Tax=Lobelia muscoides TaxID=2010895 RepID=A0A1Z2R0K6_9ASTR|nr:hypothetical protein Lo_mus1Pt0567 [Lobelia muscoides]ASA37222.1 hypothetical protein Lo_mus1Pt0567 [Lobelia muscoides]
MNSRNYKVDAEVFYLFWNMELHSFFGQLTLWYLLKWGRETNSLVHRLALTYLLHRGNETNSFCVKLALTYLLHRGNKTNSVCDHIVRKYLSSRGLEINSFSLFAILALGLTHLFTRENETNSFCERLVRMYLVKRCYEAIQKGLSVRGVGEVFDLAQGEGENLIDRTLERISKTPMAWQTAKIAVACRFIEAFQQENTDAFEYTASLGYWTGALDRLRQLEKPEPD